MPHLKETPNTPVDRFRRAANTSLQDPKSIILERFEHRDASQISLNFPYDVKIKELIMQLSFVTWSKTYRCFYMGDEHSNVDQMIRHCRGKIWIDLSSLRKRVDAATPKKGKTVEKSKKKERLVGQPQKIRDTIPHATMEHIEQMRRWMHQKRYSSNTVDTYISFVVQFFARNLSLAWDAISIEKITDYNHKYFIVKQRSYSSQNQWINAIKLYLKVHHLDMGDLRDIDRPRKQKYLPDVLSADEVKRILEQTSNLKHRTLLMLIYSCGLRIGETLNLQIGDVQSQEGLIYIRGGKGHKDRRVPLSPRILEQLRVYYKSYHPRTYLFEGQSGGPYSDRSAAQVLKRSVAKTGIRKRVTLHTLRHSYATHVTQKGVNIQYLQEILGHNSPKTTMIYTHLSGKDIRAVRSPLDDLDI